MIITSKIQINRSDSVTIKQKVNKKSEDKSCASTIKKEIYDLLTAQNTDLRTETGMIRETTLMTGTFRPPLNYLATLSATYYIRNSEISVFVSTLGRQNNE